VRASDLLPAAPTPAINRASLDNDNDDNDNDDDDDDDYDDYDDHRLSRHRRPPHRSHLTLRGRMTLIFDPLTLDGDHTRRSRHVFNSSAAFD